MKTSDKTILRINDLAEQPDSRYVLLPAGLDRVIVGCNSFEFSDEQLFVYASEDGTGWPLFVCPAAGGYVLVQRVLTSHETLLETMKRLHSDEQEAERLHEEFVKADKPDAGLKVLRPGKIDPTDDRPHGTYL
jgi:hypothetical protein